MVLLPDIRPAKVDDLPGLVQVKQLTWPEEAVRPGQVEKILHDPAHDIFVVEMQGQVAGFIDGFVTQSAQGELRWEIDLLAVHPAWRSRQLGQQLILACLKAGQKRGAAFARALIQTANRASQISFERCGFQCQPEMLNLYVAPADEVLFSSDESNGYMLAVHTINYSGIWLEEDTSKSSLMAAQAVCWQEKCELVGTLVIQTNLTDNEKMIESGFAKVDDYQWWTRTIGELRDLRDGVAIRNSTTG